MNLGPAADLEAAIEKVRELGLDPDSAGGATALSHLLRAEPTPSQPNVTVEGAVATEPPDTNPATTLASWLNVDIARIEDVVEFGESGALLRLSTKRLPRSKADRQRLLTLLKLAVDRIAYEAPEISTQAINALCSEYACLDQNVPHNVASRTDLVTRRGRRGAYTYRVTQPGMQRAREVLGELLDGDGVIAV